MFRSSSLFVIALLLTSCSSNNQPLEGQPISENPLLPLSTTNDHADPTEEQENQGATMSSEEKVIHLDEEPFAPGYTVPQEEPAKQNKIEEPKVSDQFRLPLQEFKERWNAITTEQGTEVEISSLTKTDGNHYKAEINKDLEIQLSTVKDKVQFVTLNSRNSSNQGKTMMLASWSHIVYLLEPNANPDQIDELFAEFGVGPNLDVGKVKEKTVERNGILYRVTPMENGFQLKASYKDL